MLYFSRQAFSLLDNASFRHVSGSAIFYGANSMSHVQQNLMKPSYFCGYSWFDWSWMLRQTANWILSNFTAARPRKKNASPQKHKMASRFNPMYLKTNFIINHDWSITVIAPPKRSGGRARHNLLGEIQQMGVTGRASIDGKLVTALNCTVSVKGKPTRLAFQVALLDKSRLPTTAKDITGDHKQFARKSYALSYFTNDVRVINSPHVLHRQVVSAFQKKL